jgi:hypothetical protein
LNVRCPKHLWSFETWGIAYPLKQRQIPEQRIFLTCHCKHFKTAKVSFAPVTLYRQMSILQNRYISVASLHADLWNDVYKISTLTG